MREVAPIARITVSLLAVIALAGGYYLLNGGDLDLGQRDGPEYLGVAVSLAQGDGLRVPFGEPGGVINPNDSTGPLTFYPPGVSLLLSLPLAFGVASATAATVLQGLAVAIGVLLTYVAMRESGSDRLSAIGGALVFLATTLLFADALRSEPLYLPLVVGSIWVWASYRDSRANGLLWLASGLTVAATLVRFSGVALAAVAAVALSTGDQRPSLRARIVTVALMMTPIGLWLLRTMLIGESPRSLSWHPPSLLDLKVGVAAMSTWFVPIQVPLELRVAIASVFAAVLGFVVGTTIRDRSELNSKPFLAILLVVYAITHLLILLVTVTLLDDQTVPDARQLAPAMLALILAILLIRIRVLAVASVAAAAGMLVSGLAEIRQEGGFGEEPWVSSDGIELVASLPQDVPVFSNAPDGVWVATGRSTWTIPSIHNPWTGKAREDVDAEVAVMHQLAREGGGWVVLFADVYRSYLISEEQLIASGFAVHSDVDGAVLLVPTSAGRDLAN